MTVQELRAEIDARAAMAKHIMDAWKRGDQEACAKAQKAMRDRFPNQH